MVSGAGCAGWVSLRAFEDAVGLAARGRTDLQERIAALEQAIGVAETKRDNGRRIAAGLAERRGRLEAEHGSLAPPVTDAVSDVEAQLADETAELAAKEAALNALREAAQALQDRAREPSEA